MKIAGVHLSDQRLVWIEAGERALLPLDHVRVLLPVGEREGVVYVTPDQLVRPPERVEGKLLASSPPVPPTREDRGLPGASLPPLGTLLRSNDREGTVTGLDPIRNVVTLSVDGEQIDVPAASTTRDDL